MPDKMDAKKLESYKKVLMQMKFQLAGDIKSMSHESDGDQDNKGDLSGHAMHMADVATDMYDREFNLTLASNEREILQRIDEALARISKGTYGLCLKTGKRIPEPRLKALPYAEYCLEAQEEMDRKGGR